MSKKPSSEPKPTASPVAKADIKLPFDALKSTAEPKKGTLAAKERQGR